MHICDRLVLLSNDAAAIFRDLHAANDGTRQQDPNLRQAVAQTSAAVAALEKAARCAEAAFAPEGTEVR